MVSFTTIANRLCGVVDEADDLTDLSLRRPEGIDAATSSERLHEMALIEAHEAWGDFLEEAFVRCLRIAYSNGYFKIPKAKEITLTNPTDNELNSFFQDFRDSGMPRSFGVSGNVLDAADTWFGRQHPLVWLRPDSRQVFLEAGRRLRNDVAHGGRFSAKSEGYMGNVFTQGNVPQRGRRIRAGTILKKENLEHGETGILLGAILGLMKSGARDIESRGNDW